MALQQIAKLSDIPMNDSIAVMVDDLDVLIVHSKSGLYTIENMCSHAFQQLGGGKVRKVHIFCPMHGVRFDMRNGCPSGQLTAKPIKVWHSEVDGDAVLIDLDRRLDDGA